MLAPRPAGRGIVGIDPTAATAAELEAHASDWLPLQQAACELGVSPGTARRMIRRGELRNRIVARPGGFAYLVYLPNSWHARCAPPAHRPSPTIEEPAAFSWQERVERAWDALVPVVRSALRAPAPDRGLRVVEADGPFAQYRWLARRRRWWRF
jgi:hypothetical protein